MATVVFCRCGQSECDREVQVPEGEALAVLECEDYVLIAGDCPFGPPETHPIVMVDGPSYRIYTTPLMVEPLRPSATATQWVM